MLVEFLKAWLFSPVWLAVKLAFWVAAISVVVLTVLYFTFDFNHLKSGIEGYASRAVGRTVRIGGDVNFGMDAGRPSLVLHAVEAREKGDGGTIAADRIEIAVPYQSPQAKPFRLFSSLKNLRVGAWRFGDVEFPLEVSGSGFAISRAEFSHNGGSAEGDFILSPERVHLDLKGRDIRYADLLDGLSGGKFRADVVLDMAGNDLRTLSGEIHLLGGEGKIKGEDYRFWAGDVLRSLFARPKAETNLECALASFSIEKGVATSRAFVIDTEDVTIFGSGSIDLATGTIDARLDPKPKKPALINLATPVLLRGKIGEVRATPDPAAVATTVGGLLLGVLAPAAALLPVVTLGRGDNNPCLKHIEKK